MMISDGCLATSKAYDYAPSFYGPGPNGFSPLNWQDEDCGIYAAPMRKLFTLAPLDAREFEIIRQWGEYYVNAPCWDDSSFADDRGRRLLKELRDEIINAKTRADLSIWINKCRNIAIDPYARKLSERLADDRPSTATQAGASPLLS